MDEALAIIGEIAPKVPGLAVAVAMEGKTVWSHQTGYADWEAKTPVTAATRFRIASVSKPLAAAGLALLVERGQLDLDAPVQKYLPDFPDKGAVITTRMAAGHLTGIRNYRGTEAISNQPYPNLRAGLKIFEDDALESPPGTKFSYCSYNWNLVGAVMEAVTRQDFPAFMEEHVTKPLGMTNTRVDRAGTKDPQRAQFYETKPDGKFFFPPPVDSSYRWPSGGYLSTAEDLVKFGSAHFQPGFLKPESLRLLFTAKQAADGKPTHYGVGWFTGAKAAYHGGDCLGGTAILWLQHEPRIVVALVSNGSQLLLRRAVASGKLPEAAKPVLMKRFLFQKEVIAGKLVQAFMRMN